MPDDVMSAVIRTHGQRWRAVQQNLMSARILAPPPGLRWLAAVAQAIAFYAAFGNRCPTDINAD